MPPRTLLVLKDGHVGSEWFAEAVSRQPGTRFLFEMGPCITGSLPGKLAFFSQARRGCACSKEDCATFRGDITSAPCLDEPSRSSCHVLGGSHISMTSEKEAQQWEQALRNTTDLMIVVQTRSNLVKWAWSFYRTGAMKRLRQNASPTNVANAAAAAEPISRERIHLRDEANRTISKPVHVDPMVLLRMIIAKQGRSERLVATGRRFARLTPARRERILLYEAMQADLQGELDRLYEAMKTPFSVQAHRTVPEGSLLKTAPEDLSRVIANWVSK